MPAEFMTQVDPAEAVARLENGLRDRALVGDVARDPDRAVEFVGDGLRAPEVKVDDSGAAALGGESPRCRRSETRAASCREQHLAPELGVSAR
jgi:hypothetical protein